MSLDVDRYRTGMRQLWGSAEYAPLAERLAPAAAALVDAVVTSRPGRVLDLAAGIGTAALLAAQRGATVTAVDLSPRMVELGRAHTAGSGVAWLEADLADLPVPDAGADAVVSSFGIIFAPQPGVALAEARRVLVPGGVLGLTSWEPEGFMGRMTEVIRRHTPPVDGVADQMDWGRPEVVQAWLRDAGFTAVTTTSASIPWHFESPAAMTAFLRAHSPAHAATAIGLGGRADALFAEIEDLAGPPGHAVRLDVGYLLVTATTAPDA